MKYPDMLPAYIGYGGGLNSSAIIVELIQRGYEPPKAIVFCDTGSEFPHTHEHLKIMSDYAVKHGYPPITVIRSHQYSKRGGLYEMSIRQKRLPAAAYNKKDCSVQFKVEPAQLFASMLFGYGVDYCNIIGYDIDERQRAEKGDNKNDNEFCKNWYPLIEWMMGRDECAESLKNAGLPIARKSSCFFCPNMRQHEIKRMQSEYPELLIKALYLEGNAENTSIAGLGRQWSWKNFLATEDMFDYPDLDKPAPCGCYDGDE